MSTKNQKAEAHIPIPFRKGNTVIREYVQEIVRNGTIYRSVLVDFSYKNKKGEVQVEEGYALRHETIRTSDSHLNTSDLNEMDITDILTHMLFITKPEYKYYTRTYMDFLIKYVERRARLKLNNLPYYAEIK